MRNFCSRPCPETKTNSKGAGYADPVLSTNLQTKTGKKKKKKKKDRKPNPTCIHCGRAGEVTVYNSRTSLDSHRPHTRVHIASNDALLDTEGPLPALSGVHFSIIYAYLRIYAKGSLLYPSPCATPSRSPSPSHPLHSSSLLYV